MAKRTKPSNININSKFFCFRLFKPGGTPLKASHVILQFLSFDWLLRAWYVSSYTMDHKIIW